jgi:hypothetical protein|eukprot:COSAG02_NODE_1714_length_11220_cov_3.198543_4_plen_74_part_00
MMWSRDAEGGDAQIIAVLASVAHSFLCMVASYTLIAPSIQFCFCNTTIAAVAYDRRAIERQRAYRLGGVDARF